MRSSRFDYSLPTVLALLLWVNPCDFGFALEWAALPGGRTAPVQPAGSKAGFTSLAPGSSGIDFTNHVPPERHYTNQILLNGSGVAAGDVDNDGLCDLFFGALGGGSSFYRNLGNWKFQNVTTASGLNACAKLDATGVALVDYDGDNDLDLFVNSVGQGTHLFLNNGRGQFSLAAPELNRGKCGSSLAFADVDGNGTLDLYVANYRTTTVRDQPNARFGLKTVEGRPVPETFGGQLLSAPELTNRFTFRFQPRPGGGGSVFHDEVGEPDQLFLNSANGQLTPQPFTEGRFLDRQGLRPAQPPRDWGLSVMMRDFNGDGSPDIYVCNDFATPDRLWFNDGKGTFRAAPETAMRQTSLSSMAVDVADINRDGFDDFFTADMLSREHWRRLVQRNEPNANMHLFVDTVLQPQSPRNMLQLGRGEGTFTEIAQLAGLEAAEWGWTSIFLDVDLDGYEDLLVANGFERDYMNMDANRRVKETQARGGPRMPLAEHHRLNRFYPRLDTANAAFRNLGNLRFADVSAEWGFDVRAVSQGMCLADLDNDGDQDVVINNSNGAATLLRNESPGNRVAIRLKGNVPNTRGIGAKIKVTGSGLPPQTQEMISGGRYLSSDDAMRVFAAGSPTNRLTVEVTWRSGHRSLLSNVEPNRVFEIDERDAKPTDRKPLPQPAPLFTDVSALLAHKSTPETLNDFAHQPLLPNTLSTLGPGVSWFDVNNDGWDDLIVPGSKGERATVLDNVNGTAFRRTTNVLSSRETQTTALGTRNSDGGTKLIAFPSHYEDRLTNGAASPLGAFALDSGMPAGPLALADVDGDGQLDLFVGARCIPGRWPQPASSMLMHPLHGLWASDPSHDKTFSEFGMVSGAVFTDIDGDGDPDLALACEWGPVRVLLNEKGAFTDATKRLGLDTFTGWWNGINAGDFDGDGRLDLIASNWGNNTKYERFRSKPLRVYYGDFNGDGRQAIIESWYDTALGKQTPILNIWTLSRSMPWLLEKFNSYEAFSRASVEEALGDRMQSAKFLEARHLESTVFLNRGERFEARVLPIEAQMAPAFGIVVADFNGDGNEDAFLAQNFFGVRVDTSRYDGGRGLMLLGDGTGGFTAMSGERSGVVIYGEQRGAAVADYDNDGRVDLSVTQAGGETKLYRNERAPAGLRVKLAGPSANPTGVGSVLRLKSGNQFGPAREVHAGSGYWSQDSAVQVMKASGAPQAIKVRWPGGRETESPIPEGAREVVISVTGDLQKTK